MSLSISVCTALSQAGLSAAQAALEEKIAEAGFHKRLIILYSTAGLCTQAARRGAAEKAGA